MTPDDRGAAALAERLRNEMFPLLFADDVGPKWLAQAAAILGERAVFLPDGLDELVARVQMLPRHAYPLGPGLGSGFGVGLDDVLALLSPASPEPRP